MVVKKNCLLRACVSNDIRLKQSIESQISLNSNQPFLCEKLHTVEPRCSDPRYDDIPGITNMLCPRFNDLQFNDITNITMSFKGNEHEIFPDLTMLQYQYTDTT